MGCRSSRLDAAEVSPAAALCRERRDLLRAAADHRARLAAAHAAYFRALPRVADALARFASRRHAGGAALPFLLAEIHDFFSFWPAAAAAHTRITDLTLPAGARNPPMVKDHGAASWWYADASA